MRLVAIVAATATTAATAATAAAATLLREAIIAVDGPIPTWHKWDRGGLAALRAGSFMLDPLTLAAITTAAAAAVAAAATAVAATAVAAATTAVAAAAVAAAAAIIALRFALAPTVLAACGLVVKALLRIEFLLTRGKDELRAAVAAGQGDVREAHVSSS